VARREIKWSQNDLGLWKSDDGAWGIFPESNGMFRLQAKTGPEPWQWQHVGNFRTFEAAADAAQAMPRGNY
jgi:hypothetical protein